MSLNEKKRTIRFVFFFFLCLTSALIAHAGTSISAVPKPHRDSYVRVKTVVEVAGSLQLEATDSNDKQSLAKVKTPADKPGPRIPMEVKAELFFDEKGVEGDHAPAIRHYWEAKADFQIGEKKNNGDFESSDD